MFFLTDTNQNFSAAIFVLLTLTFINILFTDNSHIVYCQLQNIRVSDTYILCNWQYN